MMKILLPTDFSKLSKVAVNYATELAKKTETELVLIHIVYIDAPPRTQIALKAPKLIDAMVKIAEQEFIKLTNEIKKKTANKIKISHHISIGYPIKDMIEIFAKQNKINLIVMGTKGATGLKKVLIGSNAAAVISNSTIPVITIPEHALFKTIKNIIYPSDMTALSKEIKVLIQFAKLFNSSINVIHVVSPDSDKAIDKTKIKNELIDEYDYHPISFHIIKNDHIIEAIDEYIIDIKADMLAMFTHQPNFFEKLFGKSVTREMAFHSWIPLLTYKTERLLTKI